MREILKYILRSRSIVNLRSYVLQYSLYSSGVVWIAEYYLWTVYNTVYRTPLSCSNAASFYTVSSFFRKGWKRTRMYKGLEYNLLIRLISKHFPTHRPQLSVCSADPVLHGGPATWQVWGSRHGELTKPNIYICSDICRQFIFYFYPSRNRSSPLTAKIFDILQVEIFRRDTSICSVCCVRWGGHHQRYSTVVAALFTPLGRASAVLCILRVLAIHVDGVVAIMSASPLKSCTVKLRFKVVFENAGTSGNSGYSWHVASSIRWVKTLVLSKLALKIFVRFLKIHCIYSDSNADHEISRKKRPQFSFVTTQVAFEFHNPLTFIQISG